MNNKVLIKLVIPELEVDFDLFIPVNEVVWKVKKMMVKSVNDILNINFDSDDYLLVSEDNNRIYKNNEVIIDTDIRNVSKLLLISF